MNTYVISFYETMMVYAHVLNELIGKNQGFSNGTLVTLSMWNRTFQGKINLKIKIQQKNFVSLIKKIKNQFD